MQQGCEGTRSAEAGFTLVEALCAIVVLVFGLIAVTNLMLVASTSNTIGNHSTAATNHASEVLERLKAVPFTSLTESDPDSLDADDGTVLDCDDDASQTCVSGTNFNAKRIFPGVGRIKTRWFVDQVDGQTMFIRVRSQSESRLAGRRSRAEFTTFRSCTAVTAGCPNP